MSRFSNRTAIIAESSFTFDEVEQRGNAVVDLLKHKGLQPGDWVAIATSNRADFYCCFAGCFARGVPVVVMDPDAAPSEHALMLKAATPAAIISDDSVISEIGGSDDSVIPDIVIRASEALRPNLISRWLAKKRKRTETNDGEPVAGDSPAYVMFTSGTTSKPKGVVVSRAALQYHVATLAKVLGYDEHARLLCYLPTHHTDGLVHGVAASLITGMTTVHPGPFKQSTSVELDLQDNEISHLLAVPTMLAMIKRTFGERPRLFKTDAFKCLVSTAGYLDEQLWEEIENLFDVRLANFYGMTETVSGTLYCGPADENYRRGTLGKPIDASVRIIDEKGGEAPVNSVGELQISGEHVMAGYLNDAEATDAVLNGGWFSTGDLFRRDADGFYCFAGRLKSIIKRGGITVYPEDVRKVVCAVPGVLEAEVVGLPNAVFEEIIAVGVVADENLNVNDIRSFCNERLAPERRPDLIEMMQELPRGPSGKVLREELIVSLSHASDGKERTPDSVADQVLMVAAKTFSADIGELDEDSSPESVENWDSYAGMEFVLALEKQFSLRLSARAIMQIDTVGQAIETISAELGTEWARE